MLVTAWCMVLLVTAWFMVHGVWCMVHGAVSDCMVLSKLSKSGYW